MNLERQKTRYHPHQGENYSDQNITISEYLDSFKNLFLGKKILDIGSGEIPFKPFYEDLDVTTSDIQDNSTNTIDHLLIPNQPLPFADNVLTP